MSNVDVKQMTRPELLELQDNIKAELLRHRPYRIKERVVQCGNEECWCYGGLDGHGPYLYVTYREMGKAKTMSLGPKLSDQELKDLLPAVPCPFDYLEMPDHKFMELPRSETQDWVSLTLSRSQFKSRYGVEMDDDNFGRPIKFWGSADDWSRFENDQRHAWESDSLTYNPWRFYGVATLEAVAKLEGLEARKYFCKT